VDIAYAVDVWPNEPDAARLLEVLLAAAQETDGNMTPMWQEGGAKFATIFREVLVAKTTGACAWQALAQAFGLG
jgi:hypothetical protein